MVRCMVVYGGCGHLLKVCLVIFLFQTALEAFLRFKFEPKSRPNYMGLDINLEEEWVEESRLKLAAHICLEFISMGYGDVSKPNCEDCSEMNRRGLDPLTPLSRCWCE